MSKELHQNTSENVVDVEINLLDRTEMPVGSYSELSRLKIIELGGVDCKLVLKLLSDRILCLLPILQFLAPVRHDYAALLQFETHSIKSLTLFSANWVSIDSSNNRLTPSCGGSLYHFSDL